MGVISTTFLLFSATSGVGHITVVYYDNVEVSNLHWQVIPAKESRVMSKSGSIHDAMRDLNPTVSVTDVTDPLIWDNDMELVRGNNCVVNTIDNPRTRYLINDTCVLDDREPKTEAMANSVRGRVGGSNYAGERQHHGHQGTTSGIQKPGWGVL